MSEIRNDEAFGQGRDKGSTLERDRVTRGEIDEVDDQDIDEEDTDDELDIED